VCKFSSLIKTLAVLFVLCTAFAATLGFDAAFIQTTTRHAAARVPTLRRRTNALSDDLDDAKSLLERVERLHIDAEISEERNITTAPTQVPTVAPTAAPTQGPTASPTQVPTSGPTPAPAVVVHRKLKHGFSLSVADRETWSLYQSRTAADLHDALPSYDAKRKLTLLVVIAVSNKVQEVEQWRRNTASLVNAAAFHGDTVKFSFFHWDGKTSNWDDEPWFRELNAHKIVRMETTERGCKYDFWSILAQERGPVTDDEYTWFTDADMEFSTFSWSVCRALLLHTHAWIASPMLLPRHPGGRTGDAVTEHCVVGDELVLARAPALPNGFAENLKSYASEGSAILNAHMWRVVTERVKTFGPWHEGGRTDWGVDIYWREIARLISNHCHGENPHDAHPIWIVLDAAPVIHMDTHSLTGVPHSSARACKAKCGSMCHPIVEAEFFVVTEEVWSDAYAPIAEAAKCPKVFEASMTHSGHHSPRADSMWIIDRGSSDTSAHGAINWGPRGTDCHGDPGNTELRAIGNLA